MPKRAIAVILLSLSLVTASSCRSRRKVPPPQTAPPSSATTVTQPSAPVPSGETDFVAPQQEPRDVLGDDLAEATRIAHERGWLQDAFFAFDASTLDADAQQALKQSAAWLREHPEFRVRIEGHCDERGTEQYNFGLGDRRAETVAAYLAALGVDRVRLETVSYGEERPFEEGSDEAAWAQNRRAHLVLAGRR